MLQRFPRYLFAAGAAATVALALPAATAQAKQVVSADGPGDTYALLGRVFSIETPDCGHKVDHVTEIFDDELKKNVFVFHAHVNEDDDRCGAQDRQRTEIRGGKLADVYAATGQTVYYRWKFKLPTGFQSSPNFTHIMQIKSDAAAPILTLTPRNNTMSIDGRIGARGTTDLPKFIGQWVVASMKVTFNDNGNVELKIRRISDGMMLFDYAGGADTADGGNHDPKWGIYRSLNTRGDLRDEQVRFADFCISKTSAADCEVDGASPPPPPPPGDAGGDPAPQDAGAPADSGVKPADVAPPPGDPESDAAVVPPPPSQPDAAPTPPRMDAAPRPPSTMRDAAAPPSTPTTPGGGGGSSGGCSIASGSADRPAGGAVTGLGLGLVAYALARLRRRRR